MALGKDEILEAIAALTVMELVALVEAMEEKFGVTAATAAVAVAPAGVAETTEVVEEQTEVNLMLNSFGEQKLAVIKAVREALGMGLADAKKLVESAPVNIQEGVPRAAAEELLKKLEEAGAAAELK